MLVRICLPYYDRQISGDLIHNMHSHKNLKPCIKTSELLDFLSSFIVRHPKAHNITETGPITEKLCYLLVDYRTIDEVQNPNNPECSATSLGPFRIYKVYFIQCGIGKWPTERQTAKKKSYQRQF
jgi:hypothetical protein